MARRLFEVYKEKNSISFEWNWPNGGYMYLGLNNFTFAWCLRRWGSPMLGSQKEFIFRTQVAIDPEPRFSLFTFEAFNLFEARIFYLICTIWPNHHLKLVFNLGVRLTKESREYLQRETLNLQRIRLMQARKNGEGIKNNVKEGADATKLRAY